MGGVVSQLVVLLCQHKCNPASVASLLTFSPPDPPYYVLEESQGSFNWVLDPILPKTSFPAIEINTIKTKHGNLIPGFLFRYPNAKLTIIFSHGNAADCGSMRVSTIVDELLLLTTM